MDQDLGIRDRHPLPRRAPGKEQRSHRHRNPHGDRRNRGFDELHRILDGQCVVDGAAGAVDVEGDVLVRVLGLEMQQLGDCQVRKLIIDRAAEEDDPLVEKTLVDVKRTLAIRSLLDHHRNQRAHAGSSLPGSTPSYHPGALPLAAKSMRRIRHPPAARSEKRSGPLTVDAQESTSCVGGCACSAVEG